VGILAGWQHCPRCASPLEGEETRLSCPSCGSTYYAHSAPAVSALVVNDDGRVLLARRAFEPDAGLWDTPGGFLEEGEDPRAGIRRELLEETGLEVEPASFLGVYMDTYGEGPAVASVLNLVWEARIVSGEMAPADDVSELRWFAPHDLPSDNEYAFRWVAPFMRDWANAQRQDAPSLKNG
jgi:ADP-ribose pyrophosphatase YjhB (NUDIX family)